MGSIVLLLELFAEPVANVLGNFSDPALQAALATNLRLIAPTILLFGLSGGVTGLLYALKRFTYTAVGAAVFNLGIVILAPLLVNRLGIAVLPIGVVAGSVAQLLVLLPGIRDIRLRVSLAWDHPGVQRILHLYIPIAAGLIVAEFQVIMDGRWASMTAPQSVAWMRYATTLIQLPLGLVPVAVSLAALPTLSQRAAEGNWDAFRAVFGRGLRLVLVLMLPATVGLWVLAEPMIRLLFQHGNFTAADTVVTASALHLYLLGLMFAGVDFMLNYTFYARQNTLTPAIVGMIAVGFYFVAALALMPRMGFLGLVLADSVKQAGHAGIMTILFVRSVGRLRGQRIQQTFIKCTAAALVMGALVGWLASWLASVLPSALVGKLLVVTVAGLAGGAFYVLALNRLGVTEVDEMVALASRALKLDRRSKTVRQP
jgi:putative peptidoglycan lipid II flippase